MGYVAAMRLILLALALALTACGQRPSALQCTVDDNLSFTAENVIRVTPDDGALLIQRTDGPTIIRNMLPGETCEPVPAIDWSLAP